MCVFGFDLLPYPERPLLLLQFDQGAMPHEMFLRQIERFAADVLPALQRHPVTAAVKA